MKLLAIALSLVLTGCGVAQFTASTTASVMKSPDGTCSATYTSNKDQVGLDAAVCGGTIKVDKSSTSEAAIAAAAQAMAKMQETVGKLVDELIALGKLAPKPVP